MGIEPVMKTPERWKFSENVVFFCYLTNLGTKVPQFLTFQHLYCFVRVHHSQLCKWVKLPVYVIAELSPSVQ